VDKTHNLTSSTLVRASTTPAVLLNVTQSTTITFAIGRDVSSTTVITYPGEFISYAPDYTVSGVLPTTVASETRGKPISTCETFTDDTNIFPSSHPPIPPPPVPGPDPSDPLGRDYTAVFVQTDPLTKFLDREFTDQFAYTGCRGPKTIFETKSTTIGSPNQKTSVAVLTASTVIPTNLVQPDSQGPNTGSPGTSKQNPGGNGGNPGSNGDPSKGDSPGGSSNSGEVSTQNVGSIILGGLGISPTATGSGSSENNNNKNNNGQGSPGDLPAGGQPVTIGGNTVVAVPTTAANGAPAVVVNGETATFGQTIIVSGTPVVVSGSSASPQLVVGGGPGGGLVQTIALQTPAPGSGGNAVATIVNGKPAVVVGGVTATVGQTITLNGHTGVVVTSGSVTEIVVSSSGALPSSIVAPAVSTQQMSATATKTAAPGATPSVTLTAVATTVSGKPVVVVGGITASIGQTVTINGTPVVVTTSGSSTELIFGGTSTSFLPKPTHSNNAVKHRWSGGMLGGISGLVFALFW